MEKNTLNINRIKLKNGCEFLITDVNDDVCVDINTEGLKGNLIFNVKGKCSFNVDGDVQRRIKGDEITIIEGSRSVKVLGNDTVNVDGERQEVIKGNLIRTSFDKIYDFAEEIHHN